MKPQCDIGIISGYHAHVYYTDADTRAHAEHLRAGVDALGLETVLGRWHDAPVGPHPAGSFQIAFDVPVFAQLVPWLALNRDGLSILVHPNTDDPVADHSSHAVWLGPQLRIDLEMLRRFMAEHKPA
ncbi:MAG: DOPA 4,5-dioxygenase family protein [Alphaproteobacteria bacterium]